MVDVPLLAAALGASIDEAVGESYPVSYLNSFCADCTKFASPGQHILDAMNCIGLRDGNEVPCLDLLTLPSDVS
jgi:hypothetical protein